jgi:hypothetical protein
MNVIINVSVAATTVALAIARVWNHGVCFLVFNIFKLASMRPLLLVVVVLYVLNAFLVVLRVHVLHRRLTLCFLFFLALLL